MKTFQTYSEYKPVDCALSLRERAWHSSLCLGPIAHVENWVWLVGSPRSQWYNLFLATATNPEPPCHYPNKVNIEKSHCIGQKSIKKMSNSFNKVIFSHSRMKWRNLLLCQFLTNSHYWPLKKLLRPAQEDGQLHLPPLAQRSLDSCAEHWCDPDHSESPNAGTSTQSTSCR